MLRRSLVLVVALAAALSLLASTGAGQAAGASQRAADYPVTITAGNGKVTITKRPVRIVSLSPTATESLFAIGAGKQVIAVDDQSDYPKTAPKTSLSGFVPNVEAIAAYRPDLVVISYDPKGLAEALGKLRVPVVLHNAAASLKGTYQQIRQLGIVTGRASAAEALIARMKKQIAGVVARSRGKAAGRSVYHELSPDFYSATSQTFVGRVYGLFGLKNIADAADTAGFGYPQLSAEYIVAASPDVIVLADSVCCGEKPSTVAARPGWDRISAVRSRSIVVVHDSVASRWGPRLVQFVRAVAAALDRLSA